MTRTALTLVIAIALASPAVAMASGNGDEKSPIRFGGKSAVSDKDPLLASALAQAPHMERGLIVEAPLKVVEYLMSRPELARRLMEEGGFASGVLGNQDDVGGWAFTGRSGARYLFHPVKVDKGIRFGRFSYSHTSPLAPGIRISGSGAVAISLYKGKTSDVTAVDYDVYFAEGGEALDKIAVSVSIHLAEITADLAALADGFASLCEAAHDDPESLADDMRDADDVFTKKEIGDFESAMGVKTRGKAR